jgi:hypothetical protein
MHQSTLSSVSTFPAKFVLPTLWISTGGIGGFGILSSWFDVVRDGRIPTPSKVQFLFLGAWLLGSAFILWINVGLKRVRIDGQQLFISNYVREICVPVGAIADVRQNCWLNSRPITITFKDATEFGDEITFIPKWRFLRTPFCDPIVGELRRLAGLTPGFRSALRMD